MPALLSFICRIIMMHSHCHRSSERNLFSGHFHLTTLAHSYFSWRSTTFPKVPFSTLRQCMSQPGCHSLLCESPPFYYNDSETVTKFFDNHRIGKPGPPTGELTCESRATKLPPRGPTTHWEGHRPKAGAWRCWATAWNTRRVPPGLLPLVGQPAQHSQSGGDPGVDS